MAAASTVWGSQAGRGRLSLDINATGSLDGHVVVPITTANGPSRITLSVDEAGDLAEILVQIAGREARMRLASSE
jgi:hypothetical protein